MKKLLLSLVILLLVILSASALTDPYKVQRIYGFIDDITYLLVNPFIYENTTYGQYRGIDLDYSDASNGFRYLIMPTETALTSPGLQIGTFSMLATFMTRTRSANLRVTHTKLLHDADPSVMVDYELGVMYSISNGEGISNPPASMCLSTGSIVIPITSAISTVMDGNIYFRLTKNQNVTQAGQYSSTVTFYLEVQ